jgi:hypothetical protein
LEQTIADLALLMVNRNMDSEKKRSFPGDLPRDRPNPKPIPEFDEISLYDERFLKKKVY